MNQDPTLLYPLDAFYAEAGSPLPPFTQVSGEEVPEPYRRLLVHLNDMTPTLESFHGETIYLRPVERRLQGDTMLRQVVLVLSDSHRPVEFGAIAIHLEHFPERARDLILGCRTPLGTILAREQIQHSSSPQAFFQVTSDAIMNPVLGLEQPQVLYGRRNVLTASGGQILADVLEVLPPAHAPVVPAAGR